MAVAHPPTTPFKNEWRALDCCTRPNKPPRQRIPTSFHAYLLPCPPDAEQSRRSHAALEQHPPLVPLVLRNYHTGTGTASAWLLLRYMLPFSSLHTVSTATPYAFEGVCVAELARLTLSTSPLYDTQVLYFAACAWPTRRRDSFDNPDYSPPRNHNTNDSDDEDTGRSSTSRCKAHIHFPLSPH